MPALAFQNAMDRVIRGNSLSGLSSYKL